MRILVTGSTGFTGKYMCHELTAHGHEAYGLKSDLLCQEALDDEIQKIQPEGVIHLAGISHVTDNNLDNMYRVNVVRTRTLLAALSYLEKKPVSVILASSGYVYGNSDRGMFTEASPISPSNDYAVSKLSMEYMARCWIDKLPITITRPFNYTGIGQAEKFVVPKIISHFKNKLPVIELGNLFAKREFSDVRVVVEIYRKLLDKKLNNVTVNISSARAYSIEQLLEKCHELTGHKIEVKSIPTLIREGEVSCMSGNNQRLINLIGPWTETSLNETLAWMLGEEK